MQDIGVMGVAVMGQNLILNINDHGYSVSVFNRTAEKVHQFIDSIRQEKRSIVGTDSAKEFILSLKRPRKVLLMIKAGDAVDQAIQEFLPYLEKGDVIIDGGNSFYKDTARRYEQLQGQGIHYVGMGVSGGEVGARHGPSLMPGGDRPAWDIIKPIFQAVSAKTSKGEACCEWMGDSGAGHYVKMVHNAIEYCDMQLIAETYDILHHSFHLNFEEIANIFKEWDKTDLNSYLIEITASIMEFKDTDGEVLLTKILDKAGQKGTGKWSAIDALDRDVPATLMAEAVFARMISARKEERKLASHYLIGPEKTNEKASKEEIEHLRQALLVGKIIAYAQGFMLFKTASESQNWNLSYGDIALTWREGCIIRSVFLDRIKEAYDKDPQLSNLLLDDYFKNKVNSAQESLRYVLSKAIHSGVPTPALSTALSFYDSYRSENLSANLIQALRDYFGAHTYERIDKQPGMFFHTDWAGTGGKISSTTYSV